ncbi:MAG TPA: nuclear transport factor 2 family protein [Acidobacteriota bacterium]|nr:nuclear transport factor 2 family protein [Acidobacteriota bacterium]
MRLFRIAFLFTLIAVLPVWAGDAKTEITALLTQQDQAWNRGDLDGFMKPYEGSESLVFMTSDGPLRSAQLLKERYEKRYKTGQNDFGHLTFSELQVEELCKDVARAYGKWTVVQKDKEPLSGWFTLILKKTSSGWRIIHDHSS